MNNFEKALEQLVNDWTDTFPDPDKVLKILTEEQSQRLFEKIMNTINSERE